MQSKTHFQKAVDRVVAISQRSHDDGIAFLYTEDSKYNGKNLTINGERKTHLGSCSYLGLELSPAVRLAAIEAINNFGTQFSSSRSYISTGLYAEAESLLSQIFENKNLIITPSTSMGHLVVLPLMVGPRDLVIVDHQAHYSMQYAMKVLEGQGTDISLVRHSDLGALEEKIQTAQERYDKIWYVMDGVYSMYGDLAPMKDIELLLYKYDQLHVYCDDAHGMSWTGKHGRGYALSQVSQHERMIIATSLNKSFAAGGGVILFPNAEWCHKTKMYGGHLMFSGPLQIGSLGAIVGSAKVHLSDELTHLQREFYTKLNYTQHLLKEHGLPVVSDDISPIFFVGLGLPRTGYNLIHRILRQEGYMVNLAIYPAVPENCTGVRFTINNHLDLEDIERFVRLLAHHIPKALEDEGRTMEDVYRGFRKMTDFSWMKSAKGVSV